VPRGFQDVKVPRLCDSGPSLLRPGNTPYSFLLEAELTPGPQCDRKDYFGVLLTVHLSIILVINQLDAQNLVL